MFVKVFMVATHYYALHALNAYVAQLNVLCDCWKMCVSNIHALLVKCQLRALHRMSPDFICWHLAGIDSGD